MSNYTLHGFITYIFLKIQINYQIEYAEIQFYFFKFINLEDLKASALVSVYSRPDPKILEDSFGSLWACKYNAINNLHIIDTESIISVVLMQPLPLLPGEPDDFWFVIEKTGLDDSSLSGVKEPLDEGNIGNSDI